LTAPECPNVKIKNDALDQYGTGAFKQQQFGIAVFEEVNLPTVCDFQTPNGQLPDPGYVVKGHKRKVYIQSHIMLLKISCYGHTVNK